MLEIIRKLEKVDGIKSVEPNFYLESTSIPIDPYYQHPNPNTFDGMGQWALEKIDAPGAWSITTGNSDIRVGVIDTDIMEHEDLDENVDMELGRYFSNNHEYSASSYMLPPGHMTWVSGVIGAVWNDIGIAGVCQNISLVPLYIDGYVSDIISAIVYATKSYQTDTPIQILNISRSARGHSAFSYSLKQTIEDYPGLLVASAGNFGEDNDNPSVSSYPASYDLPNIISVGATDINDNLSK